MPQILDAELPYPSTLAVCPSCLGTPEGRRFVRLLNDVRDLCTDPFHEQSKPPYFPQVLNMGPCPERFAAQRPAHYGGQPFDANAWDLVHTRASEQHDVHSLVRTVALVAFFAMVVWGCCIAH